MCALVIIWKQKRKPQIFCQYIANSLLSAEETLETGKSISKRLYG